MSLDPRAFLRSPQGYNFFQGLIGAERMRRVLVDEYVRPSRGGRLLDIGCGTALIRERLPEMDYFGVDADESYLRWARQKFPSRAAFKLADAGPGFAAGLPASFEVVLAVGVLHHLDDAQVAGLFEEVRGLLSPGGRLITLDVCYEPGQSALSRAFVSRDRGEHVREYSRYETLAARAFRQVRATVRRDLLRVPCSHCILECAA